MHQETPNFRESQRYYIGLSDSDRQEMLYTLGLNNLDDLFSHIPAECKFQKDLGIDAGKSANNVKEEMQKIASKNTMMTSFIGDGLPVLKSEPIVDKVLQIRGLTTAYTPYQPERSQGTLETLWIYQNALATITQMGAINASLYDRSTAIYEALSTSIRSQRNKNSVIVTQGIFPGDRKVLDTLATETGINIIYAPLGTKSGTLHIPTLKKLIEETEDLAAICFNQVNTFGLIERVNLLTDLAHDNGALAIGIIDPIHNANEGLQPPGVWGKEDQGVDLFIAEAQHLTGPANFGGPGLGVLGVKYDEKNRSLIRHTAGRFVGKTKDDKGNDCLSMILSTREQHIRREKATSNICSNQSFMATLCGATLLAKGDSGFNSAYTTAHKNAVFAAYELTGLEGIDLRFGPTPFCTELTLKIKDDVSISELIHRAQKEGIALGVNVSNRYNMGNNLLLLSFNDTQTQEDMNKLISFFKVHFLSSTDFTTVPSIPESCQRKTPFKLQHFSTEELEAFYQKLGEQNLSPDEGLYPLGSCTMKYNPELNEWAASLDGFTNTHPQANFESVQGNLEIIYRLQEYFKKMTNLAGVTTQPVAGAQGELVGIKMIQAYHRDRGEGEMRKLLLIPRSAHGTNPATASMAGFINKVVEGKKYGILTLEANDKGEIDFDQFQSLIKEHGNRIAGMMVTNPNTSGIFETNFHKMSQLIHDIGGLVYMDGANMNAIAGILDLKALGVDAIHNNLHKTWSIPHGGGGPGDAIVAVSEKLLPYLPGHVVVKENQNFTLKRMPKSIGDFHRHHGNFAHKVRAVTYLMSLGEEGIKEMSRNAVLSARYLYHHLKDVYTILPKGSENNPRMHEFILSLSDDLFDYISQAGVPKANIIARIGKLFLDFGHHAPTVAFPEVFGLMVEPTESFSKRELDSFIDIIKSIHSLVKEKPTVLNTAPHFTPIRKVDEVHANKVVTLTEKLFSKLPPVKEDLIAASTLREMKVEEVMLKIMEAHQNA